MSIAATSSSSVLRRTVRCRERPGSCGSSLGGETVGATGGRVRLDGSPLDEPYLDRGTANADFPETPGPVGTLFVLGDDRANAADSRVLGPVPLESVEERVVRVGGPSTLHLLLSVAGAAAIFLVVVFWPRIRLARADLVDRRPA
jgi:hypothetical protein